MDAGTRDAVRRRAVHRCEYCLLRQQHTDIVHQIEHIVAKQHGGRDEMDNLALACRRCNLQKGPNLTGIDPMSAKTVRLFHPRSDQWSQHFQFRGTRIEGLTPTGRATVFLLAMNDDRRMELRSELLAQGEL
jgi:5-methylcytosine-specific restriction endonuclease McrA